MTRVNRLSIPMLCVAAAGGCGDESRCGDCFEQGYHIEVPSVPADADPVPAALFSGWRNGWCQDDLVCTGSPDVFLGDLHPRLPWSCGDADEELIVFSGGKAPTVSAIGSSTAGSSITLDSPVQVDVTVWILSPAMRAKAEEETALAKDTYADFGTGIDLDFRIKDFPSPLPTSLDGFYNDAACSFAPILGGLAAGNDPNRLNVYYVGSFNYEVERSPSGVTCSNPPVSRPDIMLVNGLNSPPATLAHELGHALGLRRSTPLPEGNSALYGDVNELYLDPFLKRNNLMQSGSGDFVGQVTLGQIYRMHFDELSWLRRSGDLRPGYPRACQNSAIEGGPCPPLTLHPAGWR